MDEELIPYDDYYASAPAQSQWSVSADGTRIAWVERLRPDLVELRVAPIDQRDAFSTVFSGPALRWNWSRVDPDVVLIGSFGGETGALWSVDTRTGQERALVSNGWWSGLVVPLPDAPGHVAIGLVDLPVWKQRQARRNAPRDPQSDAIVTVTSKARPWATAVMDVDVFDDAPPRVLWSFAGQVGPFVDERGGVEGYTCQWTRTWFRGSPDETQIPTLMSFYRTNDRGRGRWAFDVPKPGNIDFSLEVRTQDGWLALSSADADRVQLVRVDGTNGHQEPIYASPRGDIVATAWGAVATDTDRWRWERIPEGGEAHWQWIEAAIGEPFTPLQHGPNAWLVEGYGPTDPQSIWLYRPKTGGIERIDRPDPRFTSHAWRPMEPFRVTARDGVGLDVFVMTPDPARFPGPWPLIVDVHGGPYMHDGLDWRPDLQRRADLGYASMTVNFRGSTGYGSAFEELADGEFGGKTTDDVIDATRWAAAQPWADPKRLAITGGSYGGLTTLSALTREPDLYQCGIASSAAGSLLELRKNDQFDMRDLGPRSVRVERSPQTHVGSLAAPLLVWHGALDEVVRPIQVEGFVNAAIDLGKPITHVSLPHEGHASRSGPTERAQWAIEAQFLHQCLGGRNEPLGPAVSPAIADLDVRFGGERIEGLMDALRR